MIERHKHETSELQKPSNISYLVRTTCIGSRAYTKHPLSKPAFIAQSDAHFGKTCCAEEYNTKVDDKVHRVMMRLQAILSVNTMLSKDSEANALYKFAHDHGPNWDLKHP